MASFNQENLKDKSSFIILFYEPYCKRQKTNSLTPASWVQIKIITLIIL